MAVFHLLGPKYTEAISYNLREVILLLNFCYFFSLYFIPIQLHQAVVFIDKIIATGVRIGYRTYLFIRYLLDLLECKGIFWLPSSWSITGFLSSCFRFGGFCALIFKVL